MTKPPFSRAVKEPDQPAFVVAQSHGRRRRNGERPIVWTVRANTSAATLIATFATEIEARKFARKESVDAE